MEKNIDRKTLSFGKGMTNVPSDLLSGDDELVESDGFIYRDGEMKPIQKPAKIGNIPYKIMYVHKGADFENLIAYDEASGTIYCYPKSNGAYDVSKVQGFTIGKVYDIKSVGTTLICATENGLHYLRFQGGVYKDLGVNLPTPIFIVKFEECTDSIDDRKERTLIDLQEIAERVVKYAVYDYPSNDFIGEITSASQDMNSSPYFYQYVKSGKETDFQNAIIGHVSQAINWAKSKNLFGFPFMIRYALKLYDGTYAKISNPIICYPSIRNNMNISGVEEKAGIDKIKKRQETSNAWELYYFMRLSEMVFKCSISNYGDWSDIVKGVTIFASDSVTPFELDKKWKFAEASETMGKLFFDRMSSDGEYTKSVFGYNLNGYKARQKVVPVEKKDEKIINELLSKSQFYKLFELKIGSVYLDGEEHKIKRIDDSTGSKEEIIKEGVLENLVEQEQLKVDDYYGWTSMVSKKMFPYNKRINLFNIARKPFDGFNCFRANVGLTNMSNQWTRYYVHIVSSMMNTWVLSDLLYTANNVPYNDWYYYPDPNATEMIIETGSLEGHNQNLAYYHVSLQEHPRLNGAYSFAQLPPSLIERSTKPEMTFGGVERIDSQIFTSVVNNPFVFEASGDNTVGTGRIIDIAANTEAVSQGQFGQYPLLVFTSEGIYGLSVNSEGLYSASYPISREVCNDDSPIIPTDKLIFFASKKGLMATSGGAVACVSEQMRGRITRNFSQFVGESFLKFLEGSIIAYDYRDSLLRIFKPGQTHHYIYNMVDKTFAMVNDGIDVKAAVNNYPDNLIQDKDGNVYSLIGKPDINDDENAYSGSFVTRPLKLGGSLSLKSLRAIKNLVDSDNGKVKLEIWGSNDCKHWQKLSSIYGKPWKYFTFKYNIADFKATDSFAGSIVEIQTRREDKMR